MPSSFLARHRTICAVLEEIRTMAMTGSGVDADISSRIDEAKDYAQRMSRKLMEYKLKDSKMLVKLTAVRTDHMADKTRQYSQLIYINRDLVQYVQAIPKPSDIEKSWQPEIKECGDAITAVGFGEDAEFHVLETVDEVLQLLN